MRFCNECNSMLYPCENKETQILNFVCKNCGYSEAVDKNDESTNCVYRNEIKLGQSITRIDPSIINDPTYSRTKNVKCPKCNFNEAIFFQDPNNTTDSGMKLIFVCCNIINGIYCGQCFNKDTDKIEKKHKNSY